MVAGLIPAAVMLAAPSEARACGGTFCDSGPNAMPVDQTGEHILFVMGPDYVEAHIEIEYQPAPDADKFAWIVPLLAVPQLSVGSEPLFDALRAGSVPSYGFSTTFDGCDLGGSGDEGGFPDGNGGDDGTKLDVGGPGGPTVLLQETVGAFEVTVLEGGTAATVMQWLAENDYDQDPAAEPILGDYLAEGFLFAAFKLANDAESDTIHPVVLRFDADEACVPIRLTRIAAVDDMDIRTFFLSEHRVVPQTYKHVLVNPLKLDWPNNAANYKEVITLAVDADEANGHAFVTEYAGPSDVVPTVGVHSPAWDPDAFSGLDAENVIDVLDGQGLVFCGLIDGLEPGCAYGHPLVRGLLQQFLPIPDDLDEVDFYGCLSCYADEIDRDAWGDGSGFADLMQERIVAPANHALDILGTWPTLTRMYTTISPHEMTVDPFFHENPDLPDVDLRSSLATRRILCNGHEVWTLPDGREVYTPDGTWPAFDDQMPWEEAVQETPEVGAPIGLVDNGTLIDQRLAMHNCQFDWPSPADCGDVADDGPTTGDDGTGTGGSDGRQDGASSGCGCRAEPGSSPAFAWALTLLALGLRSRRR
jgi:MYXO-CTERM domain-containing protein